ncbi:unnamed protein product (macronuclear) [Paramecium tetraurelia]|uniref:H-type lectin domain-containing protein n=1 Tax=Paramecium tetraurelia TaxID=5888 RepID=A0CAN7_PARTE|nr:uncharacterized protein GSPATT00036635001 [Paramecium tetraurelia]CAK67854.1 unnamed protein product [Paramecium tetraurelia]|eukprot:XP_001435251.1 hypothetical protein (macronuclear) [Paramecium tetraurelia strain d4-2]
MLIITFLIFSIGLATIKYDSNYYNQWNYNVQSEFVCWGGARFDATITFADTFANIPQVFITHELIDMDYRQFITSGFNLSITDITLTSKYFVMHLYCEYERGYRFKIRWFAVDDQRIQVISQFNLIPLKNLSYYYANVNCDTYFITITSFSQIGPTDVQLSVIFTPPNIVSILSPYSPGKSENLISLGFQIILGIDEAFIQSNTILALSNYDSNIYDPNQADRVEFYPFSGMAYVNDHLLQWVVVIDNNGVGTKYQIKDWGAGYTTNYHRKVRMLKSFTKVFSPILCNFIRFSSKLEYRGLPRPMFSVEFTGDQVIFTGNGYHTIKKSISNIELKINCNCITGKKIKSKLFKCQNCPVNQNNYQFEHSCYGAINLLFINARFITQTTAIQELQIDITATSCKITQLIYHQQKQTYVIVDIQIIDS